MEGKSSNKIYNNKNIKNECKVQLVKMISNNTNKVIQLFLVAVDEYGNFNNELLRLDDYKLKIKQFPKVFVLDSTNYNKIKKENNQLQEKKLNCYFGKKLLILKIIK